jgi:hypothetical protein
MQQGLGKRYCVTCLQVFQTFIDGFGVYGPLLSQVKQGFDQAIEAGLRDALDNSNLRLQLLAARQEQATATAAARAEIIDGEQLNLLVLI